MLDRKLPCYPLFVKDPNFSLWMGAETFTECNVTSWWGAEKPIYGFVKTEGKVYCFLGRMEDFSVPAVQPVRAESLSLTAFTTDYAFSAGNASVKLSFVSPLPPDDPELLSMPVCWMEYQTEGAEAEIALFVNRRIAYNELPCNADCGVRGGAVGQNGFESAFFGRNRQLPLSNNDDAIGADWGYFALAGEKARILDQDDLIKWLSGAKEEFGNKGEERFLGAFGRAAEGAILIGYDDRVSIDYFGDYLKGLYLENHTLMQAFETVWFRRKELGEQLARFDRELVRRAEPFGKEYVNILYASLRQSVAAHKLVRDKNGELLFLSKECYSNGCIATVDVTYPSMPLYLLYCPELVKGMLRPILKFARMPVWDYRFAPHDAGTYPFCCGQVYGLKKQSARHGNLAKDGFLATHFPYYLLPAAYGLYEEDMQMPVEECANVLIALYACYRRDGDTLFFKQSADLAGDWADYLVQYGFKPQNQLCTDDFAGHLKNNLNLAIKATVGIAAYAALLTAVGQDLEGKRYRAVAEKYAAGIVRFGEEKEHLPLTWDCGDETFSLKYNLAFDKIFGLGLFPQSVYEKETDCYLKRLGRFGTPLDSRKDYTKSDWLIWAASLTSFPEKRGKILAAVDAFLRESPERVPFGDWYGANGGEIHEFRARSVQGGCFILLLDRFAD